MHIPDGQGITSGVTHIPLLLHACAGVTTPAVHDWPRPHCVSLGLLAPSTQVCAPVLQEVMPNMQALPGFVSHASPAMQSMQFALPLQTLFGPQDDPADLCALLLHTIDPVAQLVIPV